MKTIPEKNWSEHTWVHLNNKFKVDMKQCYPDVVHSSTTVH